MLSLCLCGFSPDSTDTHNGLTGISKLAASVIARLNDYLSLHVSLVIDSKRPRCRLSRTIQQNKTKTNRQKTLNSPHIFTSCTARHNVTEVCLKTKILTNYIKSKCLNTHLSPHVTPHSCSDSDNHRTKY